MIENLCLKLLQYNIQYTTKQHKNVYFRNRNETTTTTTTTIQNKTEWMNWRRRRNFGLSTFSPRSNERKKSKKKKDWLVQERRKKTER